MSAPRPLTAPVAVCDLPLGAFLPHQVPQPDPTEGWGRLLDFFVEAANRPRTVGAVIARRGAFAVGVFDGHRLLRSKVDTTYVQGRTAAGGWSQQRYARRRSNQANKAVKSAADVVHRLWRRPWTSCMRLLPPGTATLWPRSLTIRVWPE